MKTKQFSCTVLFFCIAIVSGTKAAEAASLTVIADNLDNARGLGFGPDGSLYVTESGVGGETCVVPSPSVPHLPLCSGTSGAVTKIKDGKQERVLTGLPSIDLKPIDVVEGPQDIQFDSAGNPYLLVGYGTNPAIRDAALNSPGLGRLYSVDFNTGSLTSIADFANYELANNPDQGDVVSNPYALAIQGNTAFVTDAGGNDLLSVELDGSNLKTVTPFLSRPLTNPILPPSDPSQVLPADAPPPSEIPLQSVPTGVAIGPDGAAYVSELTAFPFPEGEARIYRVAPDGQPTVYADGFTQLTDLEFDAQGNLYVIQYANQSAWKGNLDGSLIQIAPDGTRTTLSDGLVSPTALTSGPDGVVYVTNQGDVPGGGQVLRIDNTTAVPEPSSALGLLAVGALGGSAWLQRKRK